MRHLQGALFQDAMNSHIPLPSDEFYLSCHVAEAATAAEAVTLLRAALRHALAERGLDEDAVLLLRFFSSDATTHAPLLRDFLGGGSARQQVVIGQTPLDSTFLSLQAYCVTGLAERRMLDDGLLLVRHGGYLSLWTLDLPAAPGDAGGQSLDVISAMRRKLAAHGMTLADNLLRTWYYVRDVDNNYAGLIKSRVAIYEAAGLTPETRFTASTGIGATAPEPGALVWLHAHAAAGLAPAQIIHLRALDHLSPTALYGVNFERATKVVYGDRVHCHISGTASIDAEGRVLHVGDVERQFVRAVQNVEALLAEGDMPLDALRCATIYLRDPHDAAHVAKLARKLLPRDCALNLTHGAVCRPEWLVELEGEAIMAARTAFSPFSGVVSTALPVTSPV